MTCIEDKDACIYNSVYLLYSVSI